MGKLTSFAPVISCQQDNQLEQDAFKAAGWGEANYKDKASDARASRPRLGTCVAAVELGAPLVVRRLHCLLRWMPRLVALQHDTQAC